MEAKEEISDTDSGIILHSGLDSPIIVTKDVSTHTRAVKLKRQSLQDRLELCILELKKLCIREAELTGHLCSDYPLLPGEKPPQIRKRIGAAFKLDEQSILHRHEDSELCSVEAKLALQQQIYAAAHRLCREEHLSKAVKKSRVQQCKREEQKLKELQDSVFQLHLEHSRSSPQPSIITQKHHGTSENSSLSDSAVLDEEELMSHSSQASSEPPSITEFHSVKHLSLNSSDPLLHPPEPSPSPHQPPLKHLHRCHSPLIEYDPAPIQNSPWKESSLDQPYQKQKSSHSSSTSSSPAVTPTLPPLETCLQEVDLQVQIPKPTTLRHAQSHSTPSTPEMHLRRVLSLRVPSTEPPNNAERDRGRSHGPRRRLTDVISMTPEHSPVMLAKGNPLYHSSLEDRNSEQSLAPSYTSSPCQVLLAEPEQLCQAQHRHNCSNHISLSYVTHSYHNNSSAQLSPRLYRGYIDEGRGHDMDLSRTRIRRQPSPCSNGHYAYWHEEVPLYQQGGRLIPHHLKLSRAPSFKEYPQHPSRALPRQVVSDELKSWHQRCHLRPQSLDRQGSVHIRNRPLHELPFSHHHDFYDQIPQRTADRTPVNWYEEEDQEIISQV
ncbi:hypothetical protein AMELA_G00008970 [Ameiurus melas]|uniref:Cytohesin Ubiquitin Protein Inducing domain-containing protein n=1 Tax=Ameiurus melas TaxID=219545 RepID=A0A7J6BG71_AMEME|nr:hypothetical protein AMELA_G00008970 [Ameiurus melas]